MRRFCIIFLLGDNLVHIFNKKGGKKEEEGTIALCICKIQLNEEN